MLKSDFRIRHQSETNSEKLRNPVAPGASTSQGHEDVGPGWPHASRRCLVRLLGQREACGPGAPHSRQGDLPGIPP